MRGKLLIMGGAAIIGCYCALVPDPINDTAAFIVAGVVPNTNIVIGPWPMIGLGIVALYVMVKVIQRLHYRTLEYTAKKIQAEKLAQKFKEDYEGSEIKRRSVIAAPQSKSLY